MFITLAIILALALVPTMVVQHRRNTIKLRKITRRHNELQSKLHSLEYASYDYNIVDGTVMRARLGEARSALVDLRAFTALRNTTKANTALEYAEAMYLKALERFPSAVTVVTDEQMAYAN